MRWSRARTPLALVAIAAAVAVIALVSSTAALPAAVLGVGAALWTLSAASVRRMRAAGYALRIGRLGPVREEEAHPSDSEGAI